MQPTADDLAARLTALRIRYVLLAPAAADPASRAAAADARGALSADPLLTAVSTTPDGILYRFGALRLSAPRPGSGVAHGPSNTGTALEVLVLLVQGLVLGLTALLALPTGGLSRRLAPQAATSAPRADVRSVRAAPVAGALVPERALARDPRPPLPLPGAAVPVEPQREEVAAWR